MDNKAIIEEIRSGNKDSIKTVYQSYAKDIYNFSKSITGDHDSAMNATKKTFINLFSNIQNGETPEDIRLAALKIAYDESCAIAMPDAAKQPAAEAPADEEKVIGDDIVDTPEEFQSVMEESDQESEAASWKDEPNEAEFPDQMIQTAAEETPADDAVDTQTEPSEGIPVETEQTPEAPVTEEAVETENVQVAAASFAEDVQDEINEDTEAVAEVTKDVSNAPENVSAEAAEDIGNTQVFNINAMDYNQDGELVIDEKEEIDDKGLVDLEDTFEEEAEEEPVKPRKKGVTAIIVIINIILILILLWLLYGLLINFGVLPQVADLGYTWFNETIYPIF